jgi:hypothetical protein
MGILTTSPTFAKALHDGLFVGDLRNDSIQASRSSFEVERLMNPEQALARFVRLVMMDLSWFF